MNGVIAVTMGEPAGVGGELTLFAWQRLRRTRACFALVDDPQRVRALARHLRLSVPVTEITELDEAPRVFGDALPVLPVGHSVPLAFCGATARTAEAVLASIDIAVELALTGQAAAVVTNPIHKAALQSGGFAHPGHTEYLAALAGVPRTVMMLVGGGLRVVPVTIHVALEEVPRVLTAEAIVETGRIVHAALAADFSIVAPRIAVAGLNPHAGEEGRMGREEITLIGPAVATLRSQGVDARGPLSADTMFHVRARASYDAALAMYHDQALIPIKTLAFDEGVNLTLGLPFVRTSPDHGTALDIAGRGVARPDSLLAALTLAAELSARRQERPRR